MRFHFAVFFFLISHLSFSQHPDDRFYDLSKINVAYLEHLTKIKIDSIRKDLKLKPLCNDSILWVAASDHARYLKGKELSHFQPENSLKKNPQLRAEFYGAVNYLCGENIARTTINQNVEHKLKNKKNEKKYINTNTYNNAAYSLAVSWVNSPPHYENLTKPDYDITGLAISYDPKTNVVTAVQKFARVLYKYEFSNTAEPFPFANSSEIPVLKDPKDFTQVPVRTDYPWKLKPGTEEQYNFVRNTFLESESIDHQYSKGSSHYMKTFKIEEMKKMIRHRHDGFAIEIVTYDQFHCGNPDYYQLQTRRNKKYIFNGTVVKPVYKKEIFKNFKLETKEIKKKKKKDIAAVKDSPKLKKEEKKIKIQEIKKRRKEPWFIETLTGVIPENSINGYYELNLIVLQKNHAAYVMHFSDYCEESDLMSTKVKLIPDWNMTKIGNIVTTRRLSFDIPFDRNAYQITEAEMQAIRDSIPKGLKIKEINIEAWSSVEGLEKINLDLQKKRAENIRKITTYLEADSTIQVNITAEENWPLFYEQLDSTVYAKKWSGFSKEKIKSLLEEKKYLEEFQIQLKEQRRAELEIIYEEVIVIDTSAKNISQFLYGLILELGKATEKKPANPGSVNTATTLQYLLYQLYEQRKISTAYFTMIDIPQKKQFIPILNNKLWFEYTEVYNSAPPGDRLKEISKGLKFCASDKTVDKTIKFNYYSFLVNNWSDKMYPGSPSAKDLGKMIDELASYVEENPVKSLPLLKENIEELLFNYHIKRATFYQKNPETWEEMNESLEFIYQYYEKKNLSDSMVYEIASYFVKFDRLDLAKYILGPRIIIEKPDVKLLSFYLKITFEHIEEAADMSFYRTLTEAKDLMSEEEWCDLFVGPCKISFQVFDSEQMRNLYCKTCADKGNFVTRGR